ncbi:polysaccharide biosynthesis/export family protein [Candidatus Sumerlaeota bacterium]|nr:polysaccharide biosynthesis/export family protein [Candidatus Sumerlaeota bacterium]
MRLPFRSSNVAEEIEIPKTSFSFDEDQQPFSILKEYKMVPGDVVDVLYHINNPDISQINFTIQVDYVISVKFVHFPDLNETQVVRPDGMISLPYLGTVYVVGLTVDQLTRKLKELYSKEMRDPEIFVQVPEYRRDIEEFKRDLHTSPRGLSRLVTVRPDGYATFAMLGDVRVAGRTVPEVSEDLNEEYPKIFPLLGVDLFLETHAGANIYVLGQVSRQGSFPVQDFATIVEALALAGGPTNKARLDSVVVYRRDENAKLLARRVDVTKMLNLKKGAMAFYLLPNDVVFVPKRAVSRLAEVTDEVADVLMFRGWGVSLAGNYDLNPQEQPK